MKRVIPPSKMAPGQTPNNPHTQAPHVSAQQATHIQHTRICERCSHPQRILREDDVHEDQDALDSAGGVVAVFHAPNRTEKTTTHGGGGGPPRRRLSSHGGEEDAAAGAAFQRVYVEPRGPAAVSFLGAERDLYRDSILWRRLVLCRRAESKPRAWGEMPETPHAHTHAHMAGKQARAKSVKPVDPEPPPLPAPPRPPPGRLSSPSCPGRAGPWSPGDRRTSGPRR